MIEDEKSNINPALSVEEYFVIARRMWDVVGEDNFRRLIDDFYVGVASDEVMRPMYPDDLKPAKERLYLFVIQYFGGPTTYSDTRGHPALKVRHTRFRLDEEARRRWVKHMQHAIDQNPMSIESKAFIMGYFEHTAEFLKNS
jgi:hemoglobin